MGLIILRAPLKCKTASGGEAMLESTYAADHPHPSAPPTHCNWSVWHIALFFFLLNERFKCCPSSAAGCNVLCTHSNEAPETLLFPHYEDHSIGKCIWWRKFQQQLPLCWIRTSCGPSISTESWYTTCCVWAEHWSHFVICLHLEIHGSLDPTILCRVPWRRVIFFC